MNRFASCVFALVLCAGLLPAQDRPNVLWIYVEDLCDWLGCYGDELAQTPTIDALAARGARFERAYMPSAVCSPTRSAVITGCYQTSIGAHNHRSSRTPDDQIALPDGVRTIPELLREAGYYTFNRGKLDYNFTHDPEALYDHHDPDMRLDRLREVASLWRPAAAAQKPFFGQIQLRGGKNNEPAKVDPSKVEVPPYYPDTPVVREEIAHHYDVIHKTDREVKRILAALAKDGLLDETVVFFFSDHGYRMHRHKQFLYEGGVKVPWIVAGPGVPAGVRDDLVSGIDLGATTLAMAGVARPAAMQGQDVFADGYARAFVVSARDRCDYTIDRIRAVVTDRFRYIRNELPDRPYMQPQYRDAWRITRQLRERAAAGQLNGDQMQFYGARRPREELYDLQADPHQVDNLAGRDSHRPSLLLHRAILDAWIRRTGDRGQQPESRAGLRAVLDRWKDKCVNREYDPVRAEIAAENAGKQRVLILGDSISMGYTPFVQRLLRQDVWVLRPAENCAGTTKGVANVDRWLQIEGGEWDLIWFNFGLHDLKRVQPNGRNSNDPKHGRQAEPEVYERQLREIVGKLQATGAKLVFATTTPIPEGGVKPHRDVDDAPRYNAIARAVMADQGVDVVDLHAFVLARQQRIQPRVDVHFTKEGSRLLGEEVAARIRERLQKPGK
ncbi:MAG: sulfatase-like hydrolase/transferase [Planctomycetota bacterium]